MRINVAIDLRIPHSKNIWPFKTITMQSDFEKKGKLDNSINLMAFSFQMPYRQMTMSNF